jgi:hypothetical protein
MGRRFYSLHPGLFSTHEIPWMALHAKSLDGDAPGR